MDLASKRITPTNEALREQFLISLLTVLLFWCVKAHADNGFEAMGYLTYTRFDAASNSIRKNVMMFDVKVLNSAWYIRTEPVVEGNGLGYYEVSNSTNDYLLQVTGLDSAYKSVDSPFQTLRAELKQSRKDDVFFIKPTLQGGPASRSNYSKLIGPSTQSITNQADNVALATVLKGKYPAVDQSYAALLWFAFTTPDPLSVGPDQYLLQIWDDGNPSKVRFRRARWTQFPELPHLVSVAHYDWIGKELFPSGMLRDLNVSDVDEPSEAAAIYEVAVTTNFNKATLPMGFKLTRFRPKRLEGADPLVSSTIIAEVTRLGPLTSDKMLNAKIPGRTFVSDYRLSKLDSQQISLGYLVDSNTLPSTNDLDQSSPYAGKQKERRAFASKPYIRWLVFLVFASLSGIAFWSVRSRSC